jgi:hypothetical protein
VGSAIDVTSYQSIHGYRRSLKKRRAAKHKSIKAIIATGIFHDRFSADSW